MAVQHHQTIQDDGKFKKQHTIHIQTRLLEQPASCMQAYVHDWRMYIIDATQYDISLIPACQRQIHACRGLVSFPLAVTISLLCNM